MDNEPITPEKIKAQYLKEYSFSYIKRLLKQMVKEDLILEASHCIQGTGYVYSLGFYIRNKS